MQLVREILMIESISIGEKTKGTTKQYSDMVYWWFFYGTYTASLKRMQKPTIFVINSSSKKAKETRILFFVVYMLQFEFTFFKIENYSFNNAWGRTAKFES